ncbi:TetR/AcrR family transcriptional regulator [Kineosporia sp. NBRC 101731]|uniref:TetR/AcrR family transcriptional regulator n=1 Tax=Kineosporia sp. NBRC 101731 TaxID=3032199 RepID=UPI0024A2ADD5|nr:TetR/AcrR family transcriptional regulator [Kineosporia sp. NBRC 101731]GLY31055.1 TetR family transcriptional regulator [Kineosporia sp. NBRC 101731]
MSSRRVQSTHRRRGTQLESAILQAVLEELLETGYADLSMTAIATRAGTSKPVLYRRWPSKARIVLAALQGRYQASEIQTPDRGDLRSDLLAAMTSLASTIADVTPELLWGLLADSGADPELAGAVRAEFTDNEPGDWLDVVLERAVERGELFGATLTPRQRRLPMQLMHEQVMSAGHLTQSDLSEMVDEVLSPLLRSAGLRSGAGGGTVAG